MAGKAKRMKMSHPNVTNSKNSKSKSLVDKELLSKAIELYYKDKTSTDFAWGKQMQADELAFSSFVVEELGEIKIPVSLKDIKNMKKVSEEAPFGKGKNMSLDPSLRQARQLDAQKVILTTPENLGLSSLVVDNFGLPSEFMKIQAKLANVILYENCGHYERDFHCSEFENTFATVVLQLPVKGGHKGGRLKVQYKGKEKAFENHLNSDQRFYLSAYFGSCSHAMEPVSQGWKLTFIYDLVWTNVKSVIPQDFPVFITAVNEFKQALTPWISQQGGNESGCNTQKEDILFFVLEGKYEEKNLAFDRLRGNDYNLAQLLRCCPFLDVHLAIATHKKTVTSYSGECLSEFSDAEDYSDDGIKQKSEYKYTRWIDSTDVTRNLSVKLDLQEQHVGPNRNLLTANGAKPDKNKEVDVDERYEMTIEKQYFFHGVLMIWPKNQSSDFYCNYGLDSLLDRMEALMKIARSNQEGDFREDITEDLQKVIAYCCTEPFLVWNKWAVPAMADGELTFRLLCLCSALNAREEGLALLKVLGEDFVKKPKIVELLRNETFEGIQNEKVAKAIAGFECQVTGWKDISVLIKRLISPSRISKQLKPITQLAKCFHDVNCVEGAKMVEDSIAPSRPGGKQSKSQKEAPLTWNDSTVLLANHPEIQAFLRSSKEDFMTYANFNGIGEARLFAASVEELGRAHGFAVKVSTVGVGKSARCEISKH